MNAKLKNNLGKPRNWGGITEPAPPGSVSPPAPVYRPGRGLRPPRDVQEDANDVTQLRYDPIEAAHAEMFRNLHRGLKLCKYAVSGSYAMHLLHCPKSLRGDEVTVLCPESERANAKKWLLTLSSEFGKFVDGEEDVVYWQSMDLSRRVRTRFRFIDNKKFDRLPTTTARFQYRTEWNDIREVFCTSLALPAILDIAAKDWRLHNDAKSKGEFAEVIYSILNRMVQQGAAPLNPGDLPHVMDSRFWVPFTTTYPHSPMLFAQCGLPLPNSGVVRGPTGVLFPQPTPFQSDHLNMVNDPRPAPQPPSTNRYGPRHTESSSSRKYSSRPTLPEQPSFRDHGRTFTAPSSTTYSSRPVSPEQPSFRDRGRTSTEPPSRTYPSRPVSPEQPSFRDRVLNSTESSSSRAYPPRPTLIQQPPFRRQGRTSTEQSRTYSSRPALQEQPPSGDHGRSSTAPSSTMRSSTRTRSSSTAHSHNRPSTNTSRPSTSMPPSSMTRSSSTPPRSYNRPSTSSSRPDTSSSSRSGLANFFGLKRKKKESGLAEARGRQLELDRQSLARQARERMAAQIQRGRERDRERHWHTRKAQERMESDGEWTRRH